MPQSELSLPQINPTPEGKAIPPLGAVPGQSQTTPMPTTNRPDLAANENTLLNGKTANNSRFNRLPLKKIIAVVALILIIGASYLAYFVWLPNLDSGKYVETTFSDYKKLKDELRTVNSDGGEIRNTYGSVELTGGYFYDISQSLSYPYAKAVERSKQKLELVRNFQSALSTLRKDKEGFRVGSSVMDLDKKLNTYISHMDEGLTKLYAFESAKLDIYSAIGDEYGTEVDKLYTVSTNTMPKDERQEYVAKLSELALASVDRLKKLSSVPNELKLYLDSTISTLEDQSATLSEMKKDYEAGTDEGDKAALDKLSKFSSRQLERGMKVQAESERVAMESDLKKSFEKVIESENKLNEVYKSLGQSQP